MGLDSGSSTTCCDRRIGIGDARRYVEQSPFMRGTEPASGSRAEPARSRQLQVGIRERQADRARLPDGGEADGLLAAAAPSI